MFLLLHPGYYNDSDLDQAVLALDSLRLEGDQVETLKAMFDAEIALREGRAPRLLRGNSPPPPMTAQEYNLAFEWLKARKPGRLAYPKNVSIMWGQFKYAMMAREPAWQKVMGREVAQLPKQAALGEMAARWHELSWQPIPLNRARNAVQHMWGHVAHEAFEREHLHDVARLMAEVMRRALQLREPYLWNATALSDLAVVGNLIETAPS